MEFYSYFVTLQVIFLAKNLNSDTIYGEDEHMHPVFIYGEMKRGEPMHHWLLDRSHGECRFVAEARMVQRMPMVIATKYNVPVVIYQPDMGHNIEGELYEMNLPMIKKLEKFIYLPNEIIGRIETVTYHDNKTNTIVKQPAIIYVKYYTIDDQWMQLPFLVNYHSKGDHGLEFRERPVKIKKRAKVKSKRKKEERRKKRIKKQQNCTENERQDVNGTNNSTENMKRKNNSDLEGDIRRKIRRMERSYNKSLVTKAPLYRDSSMF